MVLVFIVLQLLECIHLPLQLLVGLMQLLILFSFVYAFPVLDTIVLVLMLIFLYF